MTAVRNPRSTCGRFPVVSRHWWTRPPSNFFDPRSVGRQRLFGRCRTIDAIEKHGGTAFTSPFKSNACADKGGIWEKACSTIFSFKRDEFLARYHQRSNVESTFSMIKAKFRDHVRSKTDVAMKNEVLCQDSLVTIFVA